MVAADSLFADVARQLRPARRKRLLDWCIRYGFNEIGEPYNHGGYPHLGAPGGPCDAYDDPEIREIDLQFGTRLGKTFFGSTCLGHTASEEPCPMMLATPVEKLAHDITTRMYKMFERNRTLAKQLGRVDKRNKTAIELDHCSIHIAWSRSPSTLGDKNAKVGHGAEIDKWERPSTSSEAEPLSLFLDRGKNFPNSKFILESTPSKAKTSRIGRRMAMSSQSRYYVPCPHCKAYQNWKFEHVHWEKLPNGEEDRDLAAKTAYYECEHCQEKILDHHRNEALRMGVWVPAGCGIDHDLAWRCAKRRLELLKAGKFSLVRPGKFWEHPYLLGEPDRDGRAAGFHLSSLNASRVTWGEVAAKFVEAYKYPTELQNFVNQWLAETWVDREEELNWSDLAARMIVPVPRFVVPAWASMVCIGVDRQVDHYKYSVDAFGPDRSHTLDYGRETDLEVILKDIVQRRYEHEDGGDSVMPSYTLIDSGFLPKDVYLAVIRCLSANPPIRVLPCKGPNKPLLAPYQKGTTGKDTIMPGMPLIWVDPDWTNEKLDFEISNTQPGAAGSISVFHGMPDDHEDWFRQLVNERHVLTVDKKNREHYVWQRITMSHPNDYRDTKRYSGIAMLIATGGKGPPPRANSGEPVISSAPRRSYSSPDGRAYLASQR